MGFRRQRFLGITGAAVIVGAMAVGAAQARPDDRGGMLGVGSAAVEQSGRPDDRPGPLGVGATVRAVQLQEQAVVRPDDRAGLRGPGTTPPVTLAYPTTTDDGFHWSGDQIGTAGALFLAALAAAGLLAIHRRERALGG
jgi:hypothetical protein